ncbi:arrestin domain-containing protein 2-like [Nymphalis io]|uniref:arrestin domain-containing protein 2-like n=1 Tax=Inachis io TaxID=171585 RepID=UPI002167D415|nr:arrestin domain-containing protein 2-like [Nymphalis io]
MVSNGIGFRNGTITLDEPKEVYYSGQPIFGKVNFELNNSLSFLCLNVIYKGEANVLWTEEEQEVYHGVKKKKMVKYAGHEEYFNFTQCIIGGNGVSSLPAGNHSLPFQYQIPFNAPSSFKEEKGEITYNVTAYLLLQDGVTKEEIVKQFQVIAPLDLNTEEIKRPIEMEFEEVYSCNCACAQRALHVSVSAPHSGASPGECVTLTVRAHNRANVEVSKIVFQLARKMRFLSQQPMSTVIPPEEIIMSMVKGPILSKTNREYNFELVLPKFIALNLDNCGIIDVGYFLKVTMKVSGCNDDISDEAQFCMGLVPVGSTADVKLTHPMADCLPNAPIPNPDNPLYVSQPYTEAFVNAPNFQNIQICPPGPIPNFPYPVVANVVDGNMFGSKNILPGVFETNAMSRTDQNSTSMPIPTFPTLPEGQAIPYMIPQSPPPPYSMQPFSPVPSAPPSY